MSESEKSLSTKRECTFKELSLTMELIQQSTKEDSFWNILNY